MAKMRQTATIGGKETGGRHRIGTQQDEGLGQWSRG